MIAVGTERRAMIHGAAGLTVASTTMKETMLMMVLMIVKFALRIWIGR